MDVQETGRKKRAGSAKIQNTSKHARGAESCSFFWMILPNDRHDENGMEGGEKVTAVVTLCESNYIRRTTYYTYRVQQGARTQRTGQFHGKFSRDQSKSKNLAIQRTRTCSLSPTT